jgi:alkaline phosphatase
LPLTVTGAYPQVGERTDGRNLIEEAIAAGYTYVYTATDLAAVDPGSTARLLGLFADEGLPRPHAPSLAEMTEMAIDILSRDPDGFFLMVEGGQIDWASHLNDAADVITDTLALDQAVAVAQSYALTATDTLIIVTADHETGGMSVSLAASGLPDEDGPFLMPAGPPFHVNWSSTYHSGADVPVTAQGPWSALLAGSYDNTHLYRVMSMALNPK